MHESQVLNHTPHVAAVRAAYTVVPAKKKGGGLSLFILDLRRVLSGTPGTKGAEIRLQTTSQIQILATSYFGYIVF